MGPRSGDRGETSKRAFSASTTDELQWGRGPETAESFEVDEPEAAEIWASMGPRSGDRGESRLRGRGRARAFCFNGAAVRRPRRALVPLKEPIFIVSLQWGRGPETAESSAHRGGLPGRLLA